MGHGRENKPTRPQVSYAPITQSPVLPPSRVWHVHTPLEPAHEPGGWPTPPNAHIRTISTTTDCGKKRETQLGGEETS